MEFIYMVMAGAVMVLIFMYVFSDLYKDNLSDKKRFLADDFANSIQSEILLASQASEGYVRVFHIPEKLEGFEYEISINNSFIHMTYATPRPIPPIRGSIKKGQNIIRQGNGTVCLNCENG